jgi:hypothetical protein
MSHSIIFTDIRNLVEVIREQQEFILSRTGTIPRIELDILMGNVRKLYERLWELQSAVEQSAVGSRQSAVEQLTEREASVVAGSSHSPSPSVSETASATTAATVSHVQPEELLAKIEPPVQAPLREISSEAALPQSGLAQERIATIAPTLFDEPVAVADKFTAKASLYDKISGAKEDKSLATRMQKNPVSDLKKSIGINEKFSFINELFNGDLNAYNDAIEKLNSSSGLTDAIALLEDTLASNQKWDKELPAFLNLKTLVERRFGA